MSAFGLSGVRPHGSTSGHKIAFRIIRKAGLSESVNLHRCLCDGSHLPYHAGEPLVELCEGAFALQCVALRAVANLFFQRWQQIEGNVRWLKVRGISMGDIIHQRSECG